MIRIKEHIQTLVAQGNLLKALEVASKYVPDLVLLLSEYNANKKQFDIGLRDIQDFQRISARLTFKLLEVVQQIENVYLPCYMKTNDGYVGITYEVNEPHFCFTTKENAHPIQDEVAWDVTKKYFEEQGYQISCEL